MQAIRPLPQNTATRRLLPGLAVIGMGTLALVDNLQLLDTPLLRTFWPLVLVGFGLSQLLAQRGSRLLGAVLATVGSLLLARNLGYTLISPRDVGPLFVILAGVALLMRPGRRTDTPAAPDTSDRVALDTRFGNLAQRNESSRFQGGRIDVLFGQAELDLSRATLAGDEAVLDVDVSFGSVELRLPAGWQVVNELATTAGTVEQAAALPVAGAPRLVLRGSLQFSQLTIRR